MSSRKTIVFDDVKRFEQVQETQLQMLTTMHRGLSEIAKCDAFYEESYRIRLIAQQTLDEVQKISLGLEVQNA